MTQPINLLWSSEHLLWSHCDLRGSVRHVITFIPIRKSETSNFMLFAFQLYLCLSMALILTLLVPALPKQLPLKVQLQPPVLSPSFQAAGRFPHLLTICWAVCCTKASVEVVLASVNTQKQAAHQKAHEKLDKKLPRRQNSILLSNPNS